MAMVSHNDFNNVEALVLSSFEFVFVSSIRLAAHPPLNCTIPLERRAKRILESLGKNSILYLETIWHFSMQLFDQAIHSFNSLAYKFFI